MTAWWIAIVLAVGWGPVLYIDLFYPHDLKLARGFGIGWGMGIALPSMFIAVLLVLVQAFRALMFLWNELRGSSK